MSHELRTPLNAVLGFSHLLATNPTPAQRSPAPLCRAHSHRRKHLLTLISDILDLSKIEACRMELTNESLRVEAIFGEVLGVMRPLADKKSQSLSKKSQPGLVVRADSVRFKQVLMNLLATLSSSLQKWQHRTRRALGRRPRSRRSAQQRPERRGNRTRVPRGGGMGSHLIATAIGKREIEKLPCHTSRCPKCSSPPSIDQRWVARRRCLRFLANS